MVASALLRNSVLVEEWLTATTFVKYYALKKSLEKMFLRNNYSTLDHIFSGKSTYNFTKIFVNLSIITAVCYFNV